MLTKILTILADGQFHSGDELGSELGVSRAAIWKQMQKLDGLNIAYSSVKGRGYKLLEAVELFDAERIQERLHQRLDKLEILPNVDSTNTYLFHKAGDYMGQRYAVLAEQQTAGKGRRGRVWVSPFGKNIYLSLLVSFSNGVAALEGLSLMVAIAVERALTQLGVPNIGLKWPNDVYGDGKKLAGILLEVTGEYSSHCQVVIGVGINMSLSQQEGTEITQPWAQLLALKPNLSRNMVAGEVLNQLLWAVDEFQRQGFAPFQQYWSERDIYHNQEVRIIAANNEKSGLVKGVNRKGELMLKTDKGMEVINAGEVSLRATY